MTSGDEPSLWGATSRRGRRVKRDTPALGGDLASLYLVRMLEDESPDMHEQALRATNERSDARVLDALMRLFVEAHSQSEAVSRLNLGSLRHAFSSLGQPSIMPLAALLGSANTRLAASAADALGTIAYSYPELCDQLRPHLKRAFHEHGNLHAAVALANCGDAVAELEQALEASPDDSMTTRILAAFGRQGPHAFPIIDRTVRAYDEEGQMSWMFLYANMGTPDAIAQLIAFSRSEPSEAVRCRAFYVLYDCLRRHHSLSPSIVEEAADRAQHDPSDAVRAAALPLLGASGDRTYLPLLLQAAEDPGDTPLRIAALDALVTAGYPEVIPVLHCLLAGEPSEVAPSVIRAAIRTGNLSVVPRLLEILYAEPAWPNWERPLFDIAFLRGEAARSVITQSFGWLIDHRDPNEAVSVLSIVGGERVAPMLISVLTPPNSQEAAALLASTNGDPLIPPLLGKFDHLNSRPDLLSAARAAVSYLGGLRDARAVPLLIRLMTESPQFSDACRHSLKLIGTPQALHAIDAFEERES